MSGQKGKYFTNGFERGNLGRTLLIPLLTLGLGSDGCGDRHGIDVIEWQAPGWAADPLQGGTRPQVPELSDPKAPVPRGVGAFFLLAL